MLQVFEKQLNQMTGAQRLFAYVVAITAMLLIFGLFSTQGYFEKFIILVICLALVFAGSTVAVPAEERKQRTIRYSTWALMTVALAVLSGPIWIPTIVTILEAFPHLSPSISSLVAKLGLIDTGHGAAVLAVLFLAHLALIYFTGRPSSLGKLQEPIQEEFRDPNFSERFSIFCEELKTNIQLLDRDLRWNISHFVPIDADVEIISEQVRSKKTFDLLQALNKIKGAGSGLAIRHRIAHPFRVFYFLVLILAVRRTRRGFCFAEPTELAFLLF